MSEIFSKELIKVPLKNNGKEEVIQELAELLYSTEKISEKKGFIDDVLEREKEGSTALENGIAIPHAKSEFVTEPSIAIGVSEEGIDCGAADGELTKIFFLIATPQDANDLHVRNLSKITKKLVDKSFRNALANAQTKNEVYDLITADKQETSQQKQGDKFLIGVTGCATGVAHTYLAAESLEKAADEQGAEIKVETNGSVGVENSPAKEEINEAEAIIVASDKQVDLARFAGKKVIRTGVKKAVDEPEELVDQALNGDVPVYESKEESNFSLNNSSDDNEGIYQYLMNGVSFMIPFVVVGGLMIALSLAFGGEPTAQGLQIPEGSPWNKMLQVGAVGFKLMIPILAGYIAYAIGDRPALAPGMIGGWIANNGSFYGASTGAGFIGAIIAGFMAGYVVKWIKSWNFPESIRPLVPIMIIPILGTLIVASLFIFVIGAPISGLMAGLTKMLESLSTGSLILMGLIIGLMQGFDMGGPFGKVAFMFSIGMIESGHPEFMGAQAAAIPVAPLGMALATFVGQKFNVFEEEEIANGKAALTMGVVGISEGAIPFAASDPLAVIPANMIGSAVACILGFLFGLTNSVAHGGPIVVLLGALNKPFLALLAMLIGSIVTAVVALALKRFFTRKQAVA